MGPRKLSLQEGGRTPSMASIHDSLRTTSNVTSSNADNKTTVSGGGGGGGGGAPINFSFRSADSGEFNQLMEHHHPGGAYGRNWSRPPGYSPASQSPGALSQSSQRSRQSRQSGGGARSGGHHHHKSPTTTTAAAGNNNNTNNNRGTSPAGKNARRESVSPSRGAPQQQQQASSPTSAAAAASKNKSANKSEKDAIRRALAGDDDDVVDGKSNDGDGDNNNAGDDDGYAILRRNQQLTKNAVSPPNKRKPTIVQNDNNSTKYQPQQHSGDENDDEHEDEDDNKRAASSSNSVRTDVEEIERGMPNSAVSGQGSGSDGSGSGEDDGYESLGGSSVSSASSNARRTREIQKRPIMMYMMSLIAVPILFLAIYQGIAVGETQSTLNFMRDHAQPVLDMIKLQEELQEEMIVVSELIGLRTAYGISGEAPVPAWAPEIIRTDTDKAQKFFESSRLHLRELLITVSGGDGAIPEFHQRAIRLPETLSKAEIAANRNNGRLYRKEILVLMTELTVMIAILQTDSRAQAFSVELIDMQLLTRIEEYFVKSFSLYLEIEWSVNKSTSYFTDAASSSDNSNNSTNNSSSSSSNKNNDHTVDCLDFSSAVNRMDAYADYLIVGSGNALVSSRISSFINEGFTIFRTTYEPFVTCTFDNDTAWGDPQELATAFRTERDKISATLSTLFDEILNNEYVEQIAIVEGMKLLAAVVCCVIGVLIVISILRKERKELFAIINHSERLAIAVRRFVPKNQLRMMGVRSVLQVEPGYSTEVANTLVSSSITNFEGIADKMSRTELFDWLQMYVARMTYVVQQGRGYIDGIRGDKILSVFAQATDGVTAAVMMQQEADHMNVDLIATKQTDLIKIGVGVHFGVVVAGVFGDDSRLTCTMVASDVNLCSRLEGLTKVYQNRAVISQAVHDQIDPSLFELRSLGLIPGFPCAAYDLYQADEPALKSFKDMTKEDFEAAVNLQDEAFVDGECVDETKRKSAQAVFEEIKTKSLQLSVTDTVVGRKLQEITGEVTAGFVGEGGSTGLFNELQGGGAGGSVNTNNSNSYQNSFNTNNNQNNGSNNLKSPNHQQQQHGQQNQELLHNSGLVGVYQNNTRSNSNYSTNNNNREEETDGDDKVSATHHQQHQQQLPHTSNQ